jgi:hypothetical protein
MHGAVYPDTRTTPEEATMSKYPTTAQANELVQGALRTLKGHPEFTTVEERYAAALAAVTADADIDLVLELVRVINRGTVVEVLNSDPRARTA